MIRRCLFLSVGLLALVGSESRAFALEPLDAFFEHGKTYAFDAREARATARQRAEESTQSKWKLLPTISGSASYTRNQYPAIVTLPGNPPQTATITPEDQRDAFITVTAPLVDVAAWQRIGAANHAREAAEARSALSVRDVEESIARAYYQVVAADAVLGSAEKSLETQRQNLGFVRTRKGAGFASDLDEKRAEAEVERARQDVAEATYQAAIARRSLETTSGLTPSSGSIALSDDLHPEAPLGDWLAGAGAWPDVIAARADVRTQQSNAKATRAQLLPTISVSGTEHFTNATGFAGHDSSYAILAIAQIKLDASVLAGASAYDAAADAARAREDKTRRLAEDKVFDAWSRTASQIDKARAARAQVSSSDLAASLAKQRYDAGTATFLDVAVAQRDLFSAEVARVQADADLAFARVDLRLVSGHAADVRKEVP